MKSVVIIALSVASSLIGSVSLADTVDAVYEVPGFENTQDGLYDMSFELIRNGDKVSVQYNLPENLTGLPNFIQANGKMISESMAVLKGPKSRLSCDLINSICSVHYKDLDIDMDVVRKNLEISGFNPQEIQNRLAVTAQFRRDPEGIVHYGPK